MSDNDTSREDRQLAPSARKIEKARQGGQIVRSRDVSHALVLGVGLGGFVAFGPAIGHGALEMMRHALSFSRREALQPDALGQWLAGIAGSTMWIVVPCLAVMSAVAVLATMIPGGVVLTLEPLAPKFSRLNPVDGFARLFSMQNLVDLAKLVALAAALGAAALWFAADHLDAYAALASTPLAGALELTRSGLVGGVTLMIAILVASALLDVPLQMWRYLRELRMTHQEAREELRESEGDPMVRSRVRGRQREIARSRMLAAVPSADVVITNPTHYAVAIRYDEHGMSAPRVVAKGADHLAAKIREVAMDAGVPLFEAPPLARALYAHVDLDREIPGALYGAVAQVLAYVYQLRHYVPGRGTHPRAPGDLEVPAALDPQGKAE